MTKETTETNFKESLNLPRTDFPIRANPGVDDPAMIARWEQDDIFTKTFYCHEGDQKYILHDGPPYANGPIHLGHAFNKILKDITAKSQRMLGKHVPVKPGWDCHGLPIEFKVSQEHPKASPRDLKTACRAYALSWVDTQRRQFKDLGVFMDWARPYLTMNYSYEGSIMRAFSDFVEAGYIERKNRTVPWCSNCQTVLAAAEIEYQDRTDPSIFVLFALEASAAKNLLPNLADKPMHLLVWTTTPWTLPLNRAVLSRPGTPYVVLDAGTHYIIVGKERAQAVCDVLGLQPTVVAELMSDAFVFAKLRAFHPFIDGLTVPILHDASVTLDDGTAFVHCAPGCGPQDYDVGVKYGLEIFSPLSTDGRYTEGIIPNELVGMSIQDGQGWVIKKLVERGTLAHKTNIKHSYPHCWRCHKGLMFRATKQWFCDLSKHNLRENVLAAIDTILMVPKGSRNRLHATVEGRLEWCLSRQRVWGIPIPALVCTACDYAYCTPTLIRTVADHVEQEGIECWDDLSVDFLLGTTVNCPSCGAQAWRKETDTLDVWFDSGVSHYAVLKTNAELAFPADIYIEAQDQYRGWFQSSLLTSMALEQAPCMKTIFTHGFTVDEHGRKMSKSVGNVVSPHDMVAKLGTDGLRLWVASIDCTGDIVVSESSMRNTQEVFRKIRNTARFLLSNLYDFDRATHAVALDAMSAIDRYALEQLHALNKHVVQLYVAYDFTAIFHALANYCTVDLSALYLDIIKDRLYVESAHGLARRSAQTVCAAILDVLVRLMAPMLSITAEQLADHSQGADHASIHLQTFLITESPWEILGDEQCTERNFIQSGTSLQHQTFLTKQARNAYAIKQDSHWNVIKDVRSALLKAIEAKREVGLIKHSLEARVTVWFDLERDPLQHIGQFLSELEHQTAPEFLRELLIVSQVACLEQRETLTETTMPGVYAAVDRAFGTKCPRCWQWDECPGKQGLCRRCELILK